MSRALLYLHTIRHLTPHQAIAQIRYRAVRRLRPMPPPYRGASAPARGLRLPPGSPREPCFEPPAAFTFLESGADFGEGVDWRAQDMPRLWRYQLHYFDCLRQSELPVAEGERLIASWIESDGGRCADAWDPYPTATRLVNWARWYALRGAEPPAAVRRSVARQAAWLRSRRVRHPPGNHLIRNASGPAPAG